MADYARTEQGRSVVARWRILAERRLAHLVELYESGRWKVYYKEPDFLKAVQEARTALKMWEQLAPADPVQDKPVEVAIAQAANAIIPASPFAQMSVSGLSADGVNTEHNLRKA
jgi:uncharacterized repeat protein (TIGR03809 family)